MNRRTLFKSAALLLMSEAPLSGIRTARAEERDYASTSQRDVDKAIDKLLVEKKVDYQSALRVAGNPEKEKELRKKVGEIKNFSLLMEPFRVRGLIRLKSSPIEPSVKKLLLDLKLEQVLHEVATCLDHFIGVFELLKSWGCPDSVAYVGLFHAIYGTEFNPVTVLDPKSPTERQTLQKILGSKTERWIHLYGTISSEELIRKTGGTPPPEDIELSDKERLSRADCGVLANVLVANSFEPFFATGEKPLITRLRQFAPLKRFLTAGAVEALRLERVMAGL